MEQPNEQPIESVQSSKNIWVIAVTVIITALIIGGGVYAWQRSTLINTKQILEQQISMLQNQINQLEQGQQQNDTPNQRTPEGYKLINDNCTREECLFSIYTSKPLGMATIRGYYTKIDKIDWDEKPITCESFVITTGSQPIIKTYLDLVDKGNGLPSKNELGQPIVNIGLNELNDIEKNKILLSNKDETVELEILEHSTKTGGAPACFSSFSIIKVN